MESYLSALFNEVETKKYAKAAAETEFSKVSNGGSILRKNTNRPLAKIFCGMMMSYSDFNFWLLK